MRINFLNTERLVHSVKTAIATICACLLAKLIGQPSDQWIIISMMVVMCAQIYVGGMLQKSYLRLLGTLLGCLMASATIFLFGHSFIATLCSITFAGFFFSYIGTTKESYNQMGTLGAVTTVIILLSATPTLEMAVARFLEISLGILIAALVSQFIFPIHARTHLRRSQASTLEQIKEYYKKIIEHKRDGNITGSDLDESIIKSLLIQRQLAKDSAKELVGKRFDPDHFAGTLYCEREILRSINFMDIALAKLDATDAFAQIAQGMQPFHHAVLNALDVLTHALRTNASKGAHVHLPQVSLLIAALNQENKQLPETLRINIDGFIFAAEVLSNNIGQLAQLYAIPTTPALIPH